MQKIIPILSAYDVEIDLEIIFAASKIVFSATCIRCLSQSFKESFFNNNKSFSFKN